MNVLSSFLNWLDDKANSPLYWTYVGFCITWNWRFFQVIFLEDSSLFTSPRIEYLDSLSHPLSGMVVVDWCLNISWHLVPPALFTYLAIMYLPRLHQWAFEKYLTHRFERKVLFQRKKVEYEKQMAVLTRKEAEAKTKRVEQEGIIERVKTQDEKWQEEFQQIMRQDLLSGFHRLVSVIYQQGGVLPSYRIQEFFGSGSEIIAFAGTYNLIDTERGEGNSTFIRLTDKGKYLDRLLLEGKIPIS